MQERLLYVISALCLVQCTGEKGRYNEVEAPKFETSGETVEGAPYNLGALDKHLSRLQDKKKEALKKPPNVPGVENEYLKKQREEINQGAKKLMEEYDRWNHTS